MSRKLAAILAVAVGLTGCAHIVTGEAARVGGEQVLNNATGDALVNYCLMYPFSAR